VKNRSYMDRIVDSIKRNLIIIGIIASVLALVVLALVNYRGRGEEEYEEIEYV